MAGRKKTFPCGHVGKGKFCHRCVQEEERRRNEEKRKQEQARAKSEWNDRLTAPSVRHLRLNQLPTEAARRMLDVIGELKNGKNYQAFKGKRLKLMRKRDIISIPIGRDHRLICRVRRGQPLEFIAALTHEAYSQRLSSGGWEA
ncbi:MAG: hypothetical protein M2R45_03325 [Verrucomicrobia subdivision 3 bacterium]|nr:hypothetical protein [Limisphaerales bacterium]MCS1415395.1 hypothetical protein [Limisphaerales bacterium]